MCAWAIGSEYSHGTLRNVLVREPRRLRWLGGTLPALAALLALGGPAATLGGIAAAFATAGAQGIETAAWTTADGLRDMALSAGDTALAMIGYGLLGAALAVLVRSPVAAIGAGVAWLLPVESILSGAISSADRWLPGQLLGTLAEGGGSDVSFTQVLLVLGLYTAALALVCARCFQARDVTG